MPISISRLIALGASFVCKRAKHHVTGKRGIDRDLSGLFITNFPDHDDVGRLAEHRAQRRREGHPDFASNLHLIHTRSSYSTGSSTVMILRSGWLM